MSESTWDSLSELRMSVAITRDAGGFGQTEEGWAELGLDPNEVKAR
jgi:hypothetical protein